jgi:plasmid stability protein
MANLTIKDLPEALHKELKAAARAEGRSMNAYIIRVLLSNAEERARRKRMREGWEDYQKFMATLPRLGNSAELIREDRDGNHGRGRS